MFLSSDLRIVKFVWHVLANYCTLFASKPGCTFFLEGQEAL
jgi:hypothetical protein